MKTFLFLCIFNCLFVQLSISQKNTPPPPITRRTVKQGDTVAYVILKYRKEYKPYFLDTVNPTTLSEQEVAELEKLTSSAVTQYNSTQKYHSMRIRNLLSYYRQYIPTVNTAGEKEIFVNCFCEIMGSDWKTSIVRVMDGGSCFFQFKINLKTKKIRDFWVNGVA